MMVMAGQVGLGSWWDWSHICSGGTSCLSAAAEGSKWDCLSFSLQSLLIPQAVICTTLYFVVLWKKDY
jgi:hypothetical protein